MQKWLLAHYEFRYNVITDVFEYRKSGDSHFDIIDKYAINTIAIEVQDYYTDDFSLNQKGNAQRKIVEFAIINDDELDKETPKKMHLSKKSFTATN